MNPEDVRQIITGKTLATPYSIVTRGGEVYRVESHANIFIPEAYPNTFVVALRGRGIAWIGLGAIDAIHAEHEAVTAVQ